MFSSRVPSDLQPNRVARAIGAARAGARPLIDLTLTNPTAAGIAYPDGLLDPLSSPRSRIYEPHALGMPSAREAVCAEYHRRGISVASERVVLTASTSEAYAVLFKLLCEPAGDSVLVPVPSYPLFDHLTRLDGVEPVPYRLEYRRQWTMDVESVDAAWRARTRAVIAVSPNNPTGSVLSAAELAALSQRCAERGAALIVDEVFADYTLDERASQASLDGACLTFLLNGLSKSVGLPQVKLGWIAVLGPGELVAEALARLEVICDSYLSVSTPVQVAAPSLLARGTAVRDAITTRVRENYTHLRNAAESEPSVEVLHAEAGWSAVLRVPTRAAEEELVLDLLARDGVLVHPGYFFDFPYESFVIVSLLPEPAMFRDGTRRLLERVRG